MARATKKKRLVYILNYVDSSDVQHFVHVIHLLRTLEEKFGWEVALLSEKGGRGCQIVNGKRVRYLSQNSKLLRVAALVVVLVQLRHEGYRLVFVRISKPAALISAIVGIAFGMRVFYWQSGTTHDWDQSKSTLERWVGSVIDKTIVSLIHRFVTGPESMVDYYAHALRVPRRKLALLYNDVDLKRFCPASHPSSDRLATNILIVHRFSPVRQTTLYFPEIVHRLNLAAQNNKKFVLRLIGVGPELDLLKQQALNATSNVTIEFLGPVPNSEIQTYYALSDIFLMPSYREGFPRVMIEAMAMKLPIVATDAGGTRDLVGPLQSQYIVSRDDPHDFALRVLELASDSDLRRKVAEENISQAQRFATPVVSDMYNTLLSSLL